MATLLELFGQVKHIDEKLLRAETTARLDKATHSLEVTLFLDEIIDETALFPVKKLFLSRFPSLKNVHIHCAYSLGVPNNTDALQAIYPNLLLHINSKNPLAGNVLKNVKHHIDDTYWVFHIPLETLSLFSKAHIDHVIESYVENTLGIKIIVKFEGYEVENTVKNIEKQPTTLPRKMKPSTNKRTVSMLQKKNSTSKKIVSSIDKMAFPMNMTFMPEDIIVLEGHVFDTDIRILKNGSYLFVFDITDYSDSVTAKIFATEKEKDALQEYIQKGTCLKIRGRYQYDTYAKEYQVLVMQLTHGTLTQKTRMDEAVDKRVELHLHTKYSQEDAVTHVKDYIKTAAAWGHKAIGITDHGVVQAFPEAMVAAKEHDIKILYGIEAYIVNDKTPIVRNHQNRKFDSQDTFVVFDVETTGLTKNDSIIEIGAVKIKNFEIIDRFQTFVNPKKKLPAKIIELTQIDDFMLKDAPLLADVLPSFFDFIDDSILVAHNAVFDCGFLHRGAKENNLPCDYPYICTLELARALYPELARHRLDRVAKHLKVDLENHHRAIDDATATAEIFKYMLEKIEAEHSFQYVSEINTLGKKRNINSLPSHHAIIYAKNQKGLQSLYKLISDSHLHTFYRTPRMLKSEIWLHKENLLLGSACSSGEVFEGVMMDTSEEALDEMMDFYDYLEVQPLSNNDYLVLTQMVANKKDLEKINKEIIALGEKYNKLVVATSDCHFLHPQDEVYRQILLSKNKFKNVDHPTPLYMKTTDDMLFEFEYLDKDKAYEIVVTNSQKISDLCDTIEPIPSGTYPIVIPHAEEDLENGTWGTAKKTYGSPIPEIVKNRLDKELASILGNGFASLYIVSKKLVEKSVGDGYLVGSRGSIGSSLVATLAGITEVNPLSAHYICSSCQYSDFDSEDVMAFKGMSGCDMPDKDCPTCGKKLSKEGHDIPFETFLGFDGEKEPDIDLNFSGEYQAIAHKYAEDLIGKDHVFKAGTIGTLAEKTAISYTRDYLENKNLVKRKAEVKRIAKGLEGVKRTTGQHPGGLVVVPKNNSIYEFTPIQYPANDREKGVITTHFEFNPLEGHLLKLDILGHDVPTIIKDLYDATGINPQEVDIGDKNTIKVFCSPEPLGLSFSDFPTGSLGLPEFGTNFVRSLLEETNPNSFSDLTRISGLSHGTMVWANNAQELVKNNIASLREIVSTRDQIMNDLIEYGIDNRLAFQLMEKIRRGRLLSPEEVDILSENNVPNWYIDSCQKIQYLFPKGHAVAYVMMAVRIAYFKIHHPEAFYSAVFSTKIQDFNYGCMCRGLSLCQEELKRITELGWEASAAERNSLLTIELVTEMYKRGIDFSPLDIYESHAVKFQVDTKNPHKILPPLSTIPGLGESAAKALVNTRTEGEFLSIEDLCQRTGISSTVADQLISFGIIDLPATNQLTLF